MNQPFQLPNDFPRHFPHFGFPYFQFMHFTSRGNYHRMAAVKLSKDIVRSFVDSFDTVLFDCDGKTPSNKHRNIFLTFWFPYPGVLWAGSKILHRSVETVNYLKETGKQIFYVTNNSTKTRSQYLEKLTKLGFNAEEVGIA